MSVSDPDIDVNCDSACDPAASPSAAVDALTPEVGREIDSLLRAHTVRPPGDLPPGDKRGLAFGGPGALIAGPLIKLILARLLPVVEAQALSLLDAEVTKLQGEYPTLDLSFLHDLVASVFAAVEGTFPASGPVPGP